MYARFWSKILKVTDNFRDICVHERVILKRIKKKQNVRLLPGVN
jgi:hypothetical protein